MRPLTKQIEQKAMIGEQETHTFTIILDKAEKSAYLKSVIVVGPERSKLRIKKIQLGADHLYTEVAAWWEFPLVWRAELFLIVEVYSEVLQEMTLITEYFTEKPTGAP